MKLSDEKHVEEIRRARRMFSEDRSQQDLSLGTCTGLVVLQLMSLTQAVDRIAAALEANKPGDST